MTWRALPNNVRSIKFIEITNIFKFFIIFIITEFMGLLLGALSMNETASMLLN